MMNHIHNISNLWCFLPTLFSFFSFSPHFAFSSQNKVYYMQYALECIFDVRCRIAIEHEHKKNPLTHVQKKHCEQNGKAELGSIWVRIVNIYIQKHKRKHTHSTCIRNMHQKLKRLSTSSFGWLFIRKRSIFRIVYINCLFVWLVWLAWSGPVLTHFVLPFLSFLLLSMRGMGRSIHKRMICDNFLLCCVSL